MKKKIFWTGVMLLAFVLFAALIGDPFEIAKTPIVGDLAVNQLQDSNTAYVQSIWSIGILKHFHPNAIAMFFLGLGLVMVWKDTIKKALSKPVLAVAVLIIGNMLAYSNNAQAYYAKADWAEVQEILPNQTAFLIPEVGANKTAQAAFMSEDYLNANKVAMKRITIPHVKLENSGAFSDYYVPASKLLIVDRTPVTREWVSSENRGTNKTDESFRFESKESINITTGVVISSFVKEEDAAKFVYWFGSRQQEIKAGDMEAQFASIIYGRSLAEVIDDNVRRKVQSILAREFGKRTLVDAAAQKADIIAIVEKETKDTFAPMGITISFVGYAEGLSYGKDIQESIDNVFVATKKAEAAQQLMASIPYEQAMVNINYINAEAAALKTAATNWKGEVNLPSWVVLPQGITETISGWLGGKKVAPVAAAKE